jgi:hypothetical protein
MLPGGSEREALMRGVSAWFVAYWNLTHNRLREKARLAGARDSSASALSYPFGSSGQRRTVKKLFSIVS